MTDVEKMNSYEFAMHLADESEQAMRGYVDDMIRSKGFDEHAFFSMLLCLGERDYYRQKALEIPLYAVA